MKKRTMKKMTMAAMLGGMGVAGFMYMRRNPEVKHNIKNMTRSAAKKVYNALEEN